jgi:hypothetical protein
MHLKIYFRCSWRVCIEWTNRYSFLKVVNRINHYVPQMYLSDEPLDMRSRRLYIGWTICIAFAKVMFGMLYREYTFRYLFLKGMYCVSHLLVVLEGYGSDQALLTQFCDNEHVSLINSDSEMYWSTHSLWWAYGFWRDYFCFWCLLAKVEDFAKSSSSIYKRQIWSLIWFYAF